jgi:hypothetical protein
MKAMHTYLPGHIKFALLVLVILLGPISSYATDVSFQWTANSSDLISGYKLYYKQGISSAPPYTGTGIKEGNAPISVGKVTNYTVTNLDPNKTYHFVLSAYNSDGESGFSKVITVNPTPIINNLSSN